MHTLLVWELVPEDTEMYLIPNEVVAKYGHFLYEAHNRFINSDKMTDGLKFLNTALAESDPEEGFEEYLGIFRPYKQDKEKPILETVTAVFLSGFVL